MVTPPSAPTNISFQVSAADGVGITWTDTSRGEVGFSVDRSVAGGGWTPVSTWRSAQTYTGCVNCTVTSDLNYTYRICSYNALDRICSANANAPRVAPTPPYDLAGEALSTTQIKLRWSNNSSNESGFRIQRLQPPALTPGFAPLVTTTTNAATYTDTGLINGGTYYYRILAYNTTASSEYSNVATVRISAPPAPNSLQAGSSWTRNALTGKIELRWNSPADNESGYKVERSTNGGAWVQVTTTGPILDEESDELPDWTDRDVPQGTHVYRVRAYNGVNNSPYSPQATVKASPPVAPNNLSAWPQASNQIILLWGDPSDDEERFRIERSTDGTNYATVGTVNPNTTTFVNSGLAQWATYYYRVVAINHFGESRSIATTVTVAPPNAPSNLTSEMTSPSHVTLRWRDGSNNETGFSIERSVGPNDGFTFFAGTTANDPTATLPVPSGATYYYRVRSYNDLGHSSYSTSSRPPRCCRE